MAESMSITSNVKWVLKRKGKVIKSGQGHNIVVDTGKNHAATLWTTSPGPTRLSHSALGGGDAAVTNADVVLDAEIASTRLAHTSEITSNNEVIYEFNYTATDTWLVKEFGLFNDPTAGTMFARFLTQIFTMISGDTLDVTWTIKFGTL